MQNRIVPVPDISQRPALTALQPPTTGIVVLPNVII
jgi:hypothetical protein